jgi:hypothetical protein
MSKPSGEAARDAHGKEISRSNTPFGRCLYPRPGATLLIERSSSIGSGGRSLALWKGEGMRRVMMISVTGSFLVARRFLGERLGCWLRLLRRRGGEGHRPQPPSRARRRRNPSDGRRGRASRLPCRVVAAGRLRSGVARPPHACVGNLANNRATYGRSGVGRESSR